jgi:hypothetical protein
MQTVGPREQMRIELEARRNRRQQVLDIYQEDEWSTGQILKFYKLYDEQPTTEPFPYVAIKAKGMWYVGGQAEPMFWVDLIDFFEDGNRLGPEAIWMVTDYERVYEVE